MRDIRYAARLIRQNWAFSLTVILILALCIGANTAVLAVVNQAMLKPLPYPSPERLAQVVATLQEKGASETDDSHDGRTWEAVRDHVPSLEPALYSWTTGVNLGVNGAGIYVKQQRVSAGFFHALGVAPLIGREFSKDEDRAGGPAAVILSHALWHKYFRDDPSVVGSRILLRGEPYAVIGIMPAGFRSNVQSDLWTPIRPSTTGEGGGNNYGMIARVKQEATWAEAFGQLAALVPDLKKAGSYRKDANVQLTVIPLQEGITSDLRTPLKLLWAAVAAVFVLGCVNVGGMLLARASSRTGEIATRLALGAPFSRIVRQLLVESISLGILGGIAGIAVGWAALAGLREFGAMTFSFLEIVEPDWRVLLGALALTLIAGIGFGLAPAWQASKVDLRSAQSGGRTVAGRKRFIPLGALVGGQVALSVPLLIGAGLLLHSFLHLWNVNPGFDPNHVLTARFSMQDARYNTSQKMNQLYDKVLERLHETPGIESAAVTLTMPYERALNNGIKVSGSEKWLTTNMDYVTPEFFAALRIPLLQGRLLNNADSTDSTRVAVVNQAFVRRYAKSGDILGRPLFTGDKSPLVVVGVVGDVQEKRAGWGDFSPIDLVPMVYVPASQISDGMTGVHVWFSPKWIVRSSLDGPQMRAAIENAVRSVDPLLPMAEFQTVRDLKIDALSLERFVASLAGTIAVLAILLAGLGIYGLISNLVNERTRELGIRMALGSTVGGAIRTALRPGLVWVLVGLMAGMVASFGLEKFLKSFLWGVQASDPVTVVGVALCLLLATALASLVPASRVARMNPADTLRSE